MYSISQNIEMELRELRNKITLIKNKLMSGKSKYKQKFFTCENDNISNNLYATNEVENKKMEWAANSLLSTDEALIVENCVRKSIQLIEKKNIKKLIRKAAYKSSATVGGHVFPVIKQHKNTCNKSDSHITNMGQNINPLTVTTSPSVKESTDTKKALENNLSEVEVITFLDLNDSEKEIYHNSKSTSPKFNCKKLNDQRHKNISQSKLDFNYKRMENKIDSVLFPNVTKNVLSQNSELVSNDDSNLNLVQVITSESSIRDSTIGDVIFLKTINSIPNGKVEKDSRHFKNYKHKINQNSITNGIEHKNNLNFHEMMPVSNEKVDKKVTNKNTTFSQSNGNHKTLKWKQNVKYNQDNNENEDSEISDVVYIKELNISQNMLTINDKSQNLNYTDKYVGTSTSNNGCFLQNILPFENNQISSLSKNHLFIEEELSKNSPRNVSEDFEQQLSYINESLVEDNDLLESVIPVWDFKQEPVDFKISRLHVDEKIRIMSKQEIKSLESEGIVVRTGRWSKEEEVLLDRNFKDFASQFGVKDPCLLLGIGRQVSSNKHELSNVRRFLKAKHFFVRLGKDLDQRTLWNIYIKARFDFDPVRNKTKCIAKDIPVILKLQKKYGNKWYLIGQKSGRPPGYCQRISSYYKKTTVKGKWSDQEIKNLINAIESVTGVSDLSYENVKRIPWTKVAELVPFRNADQCYREWHLHQALTRTKINYQKWDKKCVAKLIFILKNEYPVSNELDINWKEIYKSFKTVLPSCTFLKHKWYNNVKKYVPEEFKSNYFDMINYLYRKYRSEFNDFKKKDIL